MTVYRNTKRPKRGVDFSRLPSWAIVAAIVGAGLLALLLFALTRGRDEPAASTRAAATPTTVAVAAPATPIDLTASVTPVATATARPLAAPAPPTARPNPPTPTPAVLAAEVARNRPADQPAAAVPATDPALPAEPVLTGLPLDRRDKLAGLDGRSVRLEAARVQAVAGPDSFWIGPSPEQRLFVYVEETPDADDFGASGLEPGQSVSLSGTIRRLPDPGDREDWVLYEGSEAGLSGQEVYLHVVNQRAFRVAR